MKWLSGYVAIFCVALLWCGVGNAKPNSFRPPLDTPAMKVKNPQAQPVMAMARAGSRLVGVGLRGLIIVSTDGGQTWRQASCPVQVDLTDVYFPSARQGWAVGHGGVILHSSDGGMHWTKQLDIRTARKVLLKDYRRRVKAGDKQLKGDLRTLKTNLGPHRDWPFLGVWFRNRSVGYAVGAFDMIVKTTDGGKTWKPWLGHIKNPEQQNLNSINEIGGRLYIAAGGGKVFRFDKSRQEFQPESTGYLGSLFGVVGFGHTLVTYGLDGSVLRSSDAGASWSKVKKVPTRATVTGGVVAGGHTIVLATKSAKLLVSEDGAKTFRAVRARQPMVLTGVAATTKADRLAVFGMSGAFIQVIH